MLRAAMTTTLPTPADRTAEQARMLANRVLRTFRHLHKRMARQQIDVFRLYDWDIPEVRAVVDWYDGRLHLAEYSRTQTDAVPGWLETMAEAVAAALEVPAGRVFVKQRRTRPQDGPRYGRLERRGERFVVRERDLQFWVNLSDYIDTGLFADHRLTRGRVRQEAADKDVLNLFAYTGSFSVAAAKGGARTTTSVDLSQTYLDWARDNLALNGLQSASNRLVRADAVAYLQRAAVERRSWDLAVLDPPSFSTSTAMQGDFDVQRDHRPLVEATLAVLRPGGVLWFSTNHQRFRPDLEGLAQVAELVDETGRTVPEDYRNKQVHRCWRLVRA